MTKWKNIKQNITSNTWSITFSELSINREFIKKVKNDSKITIKSTAKIGEGILYIYFIDNNGEKIQTYTVDNTNSLDNTEFSYDAFKNETVKISIQGSNLKNGDFLFKII